jgi:hypothetical protein
MYTYPLWGEKELQTNIRPSTLVILRIFFQNRIFQHGQLDYFLYIHLSYIHHHLYLSLIPTTCTGTHM